MWWVRESQREGELVADIQVAVLWFLSLSFFCPGNPRSRPAAVLLRCPSPGIEGSFSAHAAGVQRAAAFQ